MDQNFNRVDHVIWACRAENQVAYIKKLSALTKHVFDGPHERPDVGVRTYLSWEGGLQILAPMDVDTLFACAMREHLETKGEGLYGVVFGVPDIEEAKLRAVELGYQPSDTIRNNGDEPWASKTEKMEEAIVGDFINSIFIFGEITYRDGVQQLSR